MRSWPGGPSRGVRLVWGATTWGSSGPRLGEVSTPIPASRSWGSATGELGVTGPGGGRIVAGAVVGPRASGQQRSTTVFSGQPQPQVDGHIGRDRTAGPYMACKGSIVETSSVAALAWLRWVIEGRIETARTRLFLEVRVWWCCCAWCWGVLLGPERH